MRVPLFVVAVAAAACSTQKSAPAPEAPPLMRLAIENYQALPDGAQALHLRAQEGSRVLAFELRMGADWHRKLRSADATQSAARGRVVLVRSGEASDLWLATLAERFGVRTPPKTMRAETYFAGLSLRGNARALTQGPVALKLFFETNSKETYAELLVDLDLAARRVELREKSPAYRAALLAALTQP